VAVEALYSRILGFVHRGERAKGLVAKVIEKVDAHYDVQQLEFGRAYKWRPGSLLLECECGELTDLTASESTCEGCGAKHARLVREGLTERRLEADERVLHPWRYSRESDTSTSLPY
jgi:hypothetical protein